MLGAAGPQPATRPGAATTSAPASASAPSGEWKVVYSLDANAAKLGPEWLVGDGAVAELAAGSLVLKSKAPSGGDTPVMLKAPALPRSVKVEFDAVLEGDIISDMSVILNGDEKAYANGYLLQFGGMANNYTGLKRAGAKVAETDSDARITPGQKHHLVAQNKAGEITLTIDDKEAFSHTDPEPLEGEDHGMIGLYTWAGKLTISKLVVYKLANENAALTQPASQPVDEKAVAALLLQLGDDNYKTREAATTALIKMGKAIHPLLKAKAQESGLDPEVASRIQTILKSKAPK
jgi:hypothetical protein